MAPSVPFTGRAHRNLYSAGVPGGAEKGMRKLIRCRSRCRRNPSRRKTVVVGLLGFASQQGRPLAELATVEIALVCSGSISDHAPPWWFRFRPRIPARPTPTVFQFQRPEKARSKGSEGIKQPPAYVSVGRTVSGDGYLFLGFTNGQKKTANPKQVRPEGNLLKMTATGYAQVRVELRHDAGTPATPA